MGNPDDSSRLGANREQFLAATSELSQLLSQQAREMEQQARDTASALNAKAEITLMGAPLVITGSVDGRAYYLRERHGAYQIAVAHPDTPTVNPWNAHDADAVEIRTGSETDLLDSDGYLDIPRTVTLIVDTVREYLLRETCTHKQAGTTPHARYCPACGTRMP